MNTFTDMLATEYMPTVKKLTSLLHRGTSNCILCRLSTATKRSVSLLRCLTDEVNICNGSGIMRQFMFGY